MSYWYLPFSYFEKIQRKGRVVESFKNNGKNRVVIASSALSMEVNFPDIRYIIDDIRIPRWPGDEYTLLRECEANVGEVAAKIQVMESYGRFSRKGSKF